MDQQKLRKTVSDVSFQVDRIGKDFENFATIDEVEHVECECCGLKEDCTPNYIIKVKATHSDKWVCGLCSEAVKERLNEKPRTAMEEALSTHKKFCQEFNSTRLNPKLSLTCAMRNIAKKSCEKRISKHPLSSKIARSTSCVPRIDLNMK